VNNHENIFTHPATDFICPRCGGDVPSKEHKGEYPGALSRADNATEICSACGTDEAMVQFQNKGLLQPVGSWPINYKPQEM
jgi:ssDNA-binding Zn-finger/Zn-ribbon topoisomerase 1